MLLPGPECLMGPCTASHCCCLHRHTLPMRPLSGLLTPAGGFHFVIGCWQITGLPLRCQARNLSWAPVPPPHAAARSRVCHGSLYTAPQCCCCQVQSVSWVPVRPPIAAVLHREPHSAMCHFQVSSRLLVGYILS
ncbi:unnamed protein product [Staurois parvus]|uniref:Uncharacterized protein n=1 Tax=Staurois parvus TaxID=386267 RepID=A0ABN9F484_9NEOB|nr:unnamed protein product [Staurois parvus]